MKYQAFDIVMLKPNLGSKIYAIVAVEPLRPQNAYVAVRWTRGRCSSATGWETTTSWRKSAPLIPRP